MASRLRMYQIMIHHPLVKRRHILPRRIKGEKNWPVLITEEREVREGMPCIGNVSASYLIDTGRNMPLVDFHIDILAVVRGLGVSALVAIDIRLDQVLIVAGTVNWNDRHIINQHAF
ncbi:hypothetical protein R7P78_26605, partial [Vibrio sp. 2091]|nr:hypothetical protein [Vibrio sp. 2091]